MDLNPDSLKIAANGRWVIRKSRRTTTRCFRHVPRRGLARALRFPFRYGAIFCTACTVRIAKAKAIKNAGMALKNPAAHGIRFWARVPHSALVSQWLFITKKEYSVIPMTRRYVTQRVGRTFHLLRRRHRSTGASRRSAARCVGFNPLIETLDCRNGGAYFICRCKWYITASDVDPSSLSLRHGSG